ncbi:MAG: GNAT family N-acetyltransferase [Pseudomonadota bacterium]
MQSVIKWITREFAALSAEQLYQILQLRQQVFVVEQQCVYLDADGLDQEAVHVFATLEEQVVACCRLLPPGLKYGEAAIGRVCNAQAQRGTGLGRELMRKALALCDERYPGQGVRISAQHHLQHFYSSVGFVAVSAPYDEDGIPHIEMLRA